MAVTKKPARAVAPFSPLAEVGTPILALAAAAAVIQTWGADLWAWSVQFQGGSPAWALAWWIMTVPSVVYFTVCAAFAVADFTGMCAHRRVQPEAAVPTAQQYLKLLGHIGMTSVLVELPYMVLVVFVIMPWRGLCGAAGLPLSSIMAAWKQAATTRSAAPLAALLQLDQCAAAVPSVSTMTAQFLVAALLLEVMFYYSHRALHHRSLYAAIHKLHHTFTAPCALASKYATHTEHVIGNLYVSSMPSGGRAEQPPAPPALSLRMPDCPHSATATPPIPSGCL